MGVTDSGAAYREPIRDRRNRVKSRVDCSGRLTECQDVAENHQQHKPVPRLSIHWGRVTHECVMSSKSHRRNARQSRRMRDTWPRTLVRLVECGRSMGQGVRPHSGDKRLVPIRSERCSHLERILSSGEKFAARDQRRYHRPIAARGLPASLSSTQMHERSKTPPASRDHRQRD